MRIYDLKDLSIKLKIGIRTLREYIKKRGLKARKGLLCDRTEPYLFQILKDSDKGKGANGLKEKIASHRKEKLLKQGQFKKEVNRFYQNALANNPENILNNLNPIATCSVMIS